MNKGRVTAKPPSGSSLRCGVSGKGECQVQKVIGRALMMVALAAFGFGFPTASNAAPPPDIREEPSGRGEGTYHLKGCCTRVELTIVSLNYQSYAAHLVQVTPGGGCIEDWAGLGKWSSETRTIGLTSTEYFMDKKVPKEASLEQIFLTYNKAKDTYSMKESGNIGHGAACSNYEFPELVRKDVRKKQNP